MKKVLIILLTFILLLSFSVFADNNQSIREDASSRSAGRIGSDSNLYKLAQMINATGYVKGVKYYLDGAFNGDATFNLDILLVPHNVTGEPNDQAPVASKLNYDVCDEPCSEVVEFDSPYYITVGTNYSIILRCASDNCVGSVQYYVNDNGGTDYYGNQFYEWMFNTGSWQKFTGNDVKMEVWIVDSLDDGAAPRWDEIPEDQTIEYVTETLSLDINATDGELEVYFINDTTRFSINSVTGVMINETLLDVGNYDVLISVNDTTGATNETTVSIVVEDTTSPIVSITYPENSRHINDSPMVVSGTASDFSGIASISINDTNFDCAGTTSWTCTNNTLLSDGYYHIEVTATDNNVQTGTDSLYFVFDAHPPYITSTIPDEAGTTSVYAKGVFTLDISLDDDIALYYYNSTIRKVSDQLLMYSYYNDSLSNATNITHYDHDVAIDVSSWENTTYTYFNKLCDAHTKEKMKTKDKAKNINKGIAKIDYEFEDNLLISIESIGGEELETDSIEAVDRYKPKFKYKKNTANKKFKLTTNKKIQRIYNDNYPGWFVIDDKYWVDFDSGAAVTVSQEEGVWVITVESTGDTIEFNSLGPLNCIEESYNFELKQPYLPVITVYAPLVDPLEVASLASYGFDIEVSDSNIEDVVTYIWSTNSTVDVQTEDFTYTASGPEGTHELVEVIVYDNSEFNYSATESFTVITTREEFEPQYTQNDLQPIVIDMIGTAGASFVTNIPLLLIVLIISGIVIFLIKIAPRR